MPIYNQGSNKCMMRALNYSCISYLVMSAYLYSNQQAFMDKVLPNKTIWRYYPDRGHELFEGFG